MSPGAQNMKTGNDALGTTENEFGSAKHENGTRRPRYRRIRVRARKTRKREPTSSVPSKTSTGAQNMIIGNDALGTSEKEFGGTKQGNGKRRPLYHRKRVHERKTGKRDPTASVPPKTSAGAQSMKTGPDALSTIENKSGRAKEENGT
jgi:hypothetical protein